MNSIEAPVWLEHLEAHYVAFLVNHELRASYVDLAHNYFTKSLPVIVDESFFDNKLNFVRVLKDFDITKSPFEHETADQQINNISDSIIIETSDVNVFMEGKDSLHIKNLKQDFKLIEPVIVGGSPNLNCKNEYSHKYLPHNSPSSENYKFSVSRRLHWFDLGSSDYRKIYVKSDDKI